MTRTLISFVLVSCMVAVGCGSDSGGTPDAPKSIDAAPSTVNVVSCTGATVAATIGVNAGGTAFMPSTATVKVNEIVHFNSGSFHPVESGSNSTPDHKFSFSNGDGCAQFTAAGTFPFYCSAHLFTGTITVTAP